MPSKWRRTPGESQGESSSESPTPRTSWMWLALLLSIAAFAAHASYFGSWLIDDAGISFAYARNLAAGAGLTSQPAAAPVEGFSNPAWTLTLSALYRVVDVREPGTLKLLAFLLVVPVFVVIWRDMAEARPRIVVATALGVLAACSPFVIWTISGLENALLACLVVALCGLTRERAVRLEPAGRLDALAGALAALAALARPDAILYAPLYPATVAVVCLAAGRYRDLGRRWLAIGAGFVPLFFGYLAFRVAFFGDWVPNTFHAKGGPSITGLLAPRKFLELAESAFGDFMWPALIVGAAYVTLLLVRRRLSRRTGVLVGFTGVAAAAYLMMPLDWMGEHRFATAFFPLAYWLVADLVATAWPSPDWPRSRVAALGAAVVTLVFAAQATTISRPARACSRPTRRFRSKTPGASAGMASTSSPNSWTSTIRPCSRRISAASSSSRTCASTISPGSAMRSSPGRRPATATSRPCIATSSRRRDRPSSTRPAASSARRGCTRTPGSGPTTSRCTNPGTCRPRGRRAGPDRGHRRPGGPTTSAATRWARTSRSSTRSGRRITGSTWTPTSRGSRRPIACAAAGRR